MSDSEASDHMGYMVEQDDDNDDGHDVMDDEDGSDGSSSDADSPRNDMFDLEAADSDDDDGRSHPEDSDDGGGGLGAWSDDHFFPQFLRLPYELRHRIWEFFCPDLAAKSCVYWFQAQLCYPKAAGVPTPAVTEGAFLEQQTGPARALLAVHHESRHLALKAFPDTLSFGSQGIIRFNAARDIILLGSTESLILEFDALPRLPGFSEHIRHLAVEPAVLSDLESRAPAVFGAFENLKTVYYTTSPAEHKPEHLRWCTSDLVKRYSLTTFEEQPGLGEDGQHMYCWPDVENHQEFAEAHIPMAALADDLREEGIYIEDAKFCGVPIWPLVQFSWDSDLRRYDDLSAWDGEGDLDWESSDGEGDNGEPDEYESDGIDDSYISDDGSAESDTRDDLVVLDDDDDSGDEGAGGSDDGSSAVLASPSSRAQDGAIDVTGGERESSIAAFSSPEQLSATERLWPLTVTS